jgi:hypothetical protein
VHSYRTPHFLFVLFVEGSIRLAEADRRQNGKNPFFVYSEVFIALSAAAAVLWMTQDCQIVYFQTKSTKFGYILEDLGMKNACIYILNVLQPISIFYGSLV